jgi:phosphatidylglycerol:prolipoprotein diacylglycerol transferase
MPFAYGAVYTPAVVPAAVVFAFDPLLHIGDAISVRIETIAIAIVLFATLVVFVQIARKTPAVGPYVPAPGLRPDDLMFIVVGAVPGALFGGRLGYVLAHLDYYGANPSAIIDMAQGGLSLTLAVPFGVLTGAAIARLIGAPVARWLHASAFPLLFVLSIGKLVGMLGATGQGLPSDASWATAYVGPGPWGSLGPEVPSHPSQLYEAILVALMIPVLIALSRFDVIARRDGGAFFAAIGLWAAARFAVASTWRDPVTVGPLRADQAMLLVLIVIAVIGLVERSRAPRQNARPTRSRVSEEPAR